MDGSTALLDLSPEQAGSVSIEPLPPEGLQLAYRAVIARDRKPAGFRIEVRRTAEFRDATIASMLQGVVHGFTTSSNVSFPHSLVVLAPMDAKLDDSLVRWHPPRNVLLELPQHVLDDINDVRLLFDLQRNGVRLVLRVDELGNVPRERLGLFSYVVTPSASVGRSHPGKPRAADPALWVSEVSSRTDIHSAFEHGASGVIGWPTDELDFETGAPLQATQKGVLDLIRLVQSDADLAQLELAFKVDPILGYLLLTLANSAAFIRARPVTSLAHAITLLGYKRLSRWLVLLLVISSKDSKALPLVYMAVQRGFFLENLAAALGVDASGRDDLFITGAFSLLDRITGQSFDSLLESVLLPNVIVEAICTRTGPYEPYLALAELIERGNAGAIERAANHLGASTAVTNEALLQALAATDALQSTI